MSFLLDSNVVSEARKPAGNPNVRAWLASTSSSDLYLSVLVVGEIRQGIERLRRRDASQAAGYERWLGTLQRDYRDRIVPISTDIADQWGRLNVPDPVPVVDGLLAATALVMGFTLVTRNTEQIARSGARLLNPFEATAPG
ncbi:MAG: type II toxin-antitoxin system VapC family toxin [Chloroflexi bacterium]|nr:type II toxin-antitoxin system VapC family toxin [Betaproteobacteria bacterium]MBI4213036.1 type II toxin-antitoxin system VapC family toxin [Chloroflexota bacterium]